MDDKIMDHLFRHQFGKMVSILTKVFGLQNLETIEDAVQDTFIKAMKAWRNGMPDNPEAWLTTAAKNRTIDLFRSISAAKERTHKISGPSSLRIDELFLDHEIADSQLKMIFTACHPELDPKAQIAFALKTISGFSTKEIAAALLTREDTIKKRLQRARKKITEANLIFEIPNGPKLSSRLNRVLEVLYVLFNEGFHSNKNNLITRKELCGEALRLCKLLLQNTTLQQPKVYALFALMCFHSARLDSKVNAANELINLQDQNRSLWHQPLIMLGNEAMYKAVQLTNVFSSFHYEAAIAAEHLKAKTFKETNWIAIANWYEKLLKIQPNPHIQLNLAIAHIQQGALHSAFPLMLELDPKALAQQEYLYYATLAEYHHLSSDKVNALNNIDQAIRLLPSLLETKYLEGRKEKYGRG